MNDLEGNENIKASSLCSASSKEECKKVDFSARFQSDHPCKLNAKDKIFSSRMEAKAEADLLLSSENKVLAITNLPVMPNEKMEKLCKVVEKLLKSIGDTQELHLPFNEVEGVSHGVCFTWCERLRDMTKALKVLQN